MNFMKTLFVCSLSCMVGTIVPTVAKSEGPEAKESPSSLQSHLEKYPNSGWTCLINKVHYRADSLTDEAKCRRLDGKFIFSKDLKRDMPTLDEVETRASKSERQRRGH